jgi:hypothetical protein
METMSHLKVKENIPRGWEGVAAAIYICAGCLLRALFIHSYHSLEERDSLAVFAC